MMLVAIAEAVVVEGVVGVSGGKPITTTGEGGKLEQTDYFWDDILGLYSQQIEIQMSPGVDSVKMDDISLLV